MAGSRRFGVRATGSSAERFRSARLRLTFLYLAIIVFIVAVLSAALYELHAHDVGSRERGREVPGLAPEGRAVVESPSVAEYLESLGRSILLADVITVAVAGGLSWLLATRTLRPIKEAVDAEQELYANAAHDLRTPLAVMRTEAEVALRSGGVTGEARQVLESSLEEISRISTMVEQMLDLARHGARGARPRGPMDLAEMARALTAKLGLRAASLGIDLVTSAETPARVEGSALDLERAIYNVLEIALAYTPSGGTVKVSVRKSGGEVLLSVTDTGIGIEAEDLPRITEPFFRGDRARGAHAGGAGLGLTIVRSVMEDHRGELLAESAPGRGTTITLKLPVA
jgi:signal transduction histidine kinase